MASPSKLVRKAYYERNKEKILQKAKEQYYADPEKYADYQREYRRKHRKLISEKLRISRKTKLQKLVDLHGNFCKKCNVSFPLCVYDFHHLNPLEKEFSIGENMHRSFEALVKEAQKCVLLCSNCHRMVHDCQPI